MSLEHSHDHPHPNQPDEEDAEQSVYQKMEVALRELLVEKNIINMEELHGIHEQMDNRGPHNGARMVAKAWCDPDYRDLLLLDATAAAEKLDLEPTWLHLVALENTTNVHNLVVCTLCSCYPWPLLGLPPDWYKSRAYRSDAVNHPRKLLSQFGTIVPDEVEVRVHDSSADMRYLVVPQRPKETEGWTEEALQSLVSRDSMIGVRRAREPTQRNKQ